MHGKILAAFVIAIAAVAPPAWAQPPARADVASTRGDYSNAERFGRKGSAAGARRCFMYLTGQGVPQSFPLAAAHCRAAAEQGNPNAQYLLGLMYDKGQGVEHDVVLAYVWLNLAAARAPERRRDAYARLRDAIASKMTRTQFAEGQAMAVAWTARRR